MECPRCQGRMVYQMFFSRCGSFEAWRCINCGQILDDVIIHNRLLYGRKPAFLYNDQRFVLPKLKG